VTVPIQEYRPIGTHAVDMAVAMAMTNGEVTTVRIYLRSRSVIATPTSFISDNNLVSEVNSRAGLAEDTTYASYASVSSTTHGADYVYVVDATVSS
jgi:hypothetical protein